MWNKKKIPFFRQELLSWFQVNGREFPWRNEAVTSYELILSEILLQKTKAESVAKYYNTFFKQFPTWESLSHASIDELAELLKPLGLYNHRAKRIYKIAQEYKSNSGVLPQSTTSLQESNLSTVYISNAYKLFLLNKRAALIDVNMSRVLRRYFLNREFKDIRNDKIVQELAHEVVNVKDCKELNWAILDYGALVCKASKPLCNKCNLNLNCDYYQSMPNKDSDLIFSEPQLNFNYGPPEDANPLKPLRLLSLFSGCGGMDIGFEGEFIVHKNSINEESNPDFIKSNVNEDYVLLQPTKFQTVFANDILVEARTAWLSYFQKRGHNASIYHVESIVDLVKAHRQGANIFPSNIDIVTGGFPCQDFSMSGLRSGFNSHKDHKGKIIKNEIPTIETRGKLYMWLRDVIEITKPKIFIAENVKGLVNLSNVKTIIQNDFASADENGYIVLDPQVLHAADYGIPQSRERVIFIGIKKSALKPSSLKELSRQTINDKYNPYPKPTHAFNKKNSHLKSSVTLKTILGYLKEPEESVDPSQRYYSKAKYMGKHCQGQSEVNIDGIGPTIRAEHHGNIEFRRLSKEHGGKINEELEIGLPERRLTPRECALIQSFPPDYQFIIPKSRNRFLISASSAYKLIGNAVPPLLAYHIAKRIEKLWTLYFKS